MTNGDRIRNMTDKELAQRFHKAGDCWSEYEDRTPLCLKKEQKSCVQCWINYLKQEAK